jgi:hypothetical protein
MVTYKYRSSRCLLWSRWREAALIFESLRNGKKGWLTFHNYIEPTDDIWYNTPPKQFQSPTPQQDNNNNNNTASPSPSPISPSSSGSLNLGTFISAPNTTHTPASSSFVISTNIQLDLQNNMLYVREPWVPPSHHHHRKATTHNNIQNSDEPTTTTTTTTNTTKTTKSTHHHPSNHTSFFLHQISLILLAPFSIFQKSATTTTTTTTTPKQQQQQRAIMDPFTLVMQFENTEDAQRIHNQLLMSLDGFAGMLNAGKGNAGCVTIYH